MIAIAFLHPSDGTTVLKNMIRAAVKYKITPSFAKLSETSSKIIELHIEKDQDIILDVLTEFTRNKVEDICLKDMIEHLFFYTDSSEQKEIFSITKSIISGEIEGIPETKNLPSLNGLIRKQWQSLFQSSLPYLEFESFLKFRLKEYLAILLKLVECAIDEYKLELEYQMFVEQLRSCVTKQKSFSKRNIVIIFDKEKVVILDENQNPLSGNELERLHEQAVKLSKVTSLDARLLGPLIGLAPASAHIYSYDLDHPLLHTVKNIFQETITISSIEKMSYRNKKIFHKKQ
ncbi:sporulation protein YtxC [Fictibacillus barbaricus]|uniref:Sporulation protein YtxC n=1 Tax=Fictibacillus barbaricus TaxID=182136 RepID=A0ABU1U2M6_9BACL|nr:sporulation protein YtxC [Fictibacillus barbaricus]MDR7073736.1 putative sporulation protein YtxC [Fictibacillus barbaricus]